MHAIIIDDEADGIQSLSLVISKTIKELKIVAVTQDALLGVELIDSYRPDIVFLDINMPVLSGFELLSKLRYRNFHLVFTTAHTRYGIQAIKSDAVDYLLKPISPEDIINCYNRIKMRVAEMRDSPALDKVLKELGSKKQKMSISHSAGIEQLSYTDIVAIEAHSNSVSITLLNNNVLHVAKSLKQYEEELCTAELPFVRIHNSFIINVNHALRYVKEEGGYLVLVNNRSVPLSKARKQAFFEKIEL